MKSGLRKLKQTKTPERITQLGNEGLLLVSNERLRRRLLADREAWKLRRERLEATIDALKRLPTPDLSRIEGIPLGLKEVRQRLDTLEGRLSRLLQEHLEKSVPRRSFWARLFRGVL